MLAVCVESVDAVLDFGENATGGIQLTDIHGQLYHRQHWGEDSVVGLCMEIYRRLKQLCNAGSSVVAYSARFRSDRGASV